MMYHYNIGKRLQLIRERERWFVWHGILFEEPNPTGSRPSDLIGLYRQQKKPHPPNTQGRARREHGGEQGHPEEAESHPEEAERRRKDRKREGGHPEEAESHPEEAERRRKDRKLEAVLKIPRSN